MPHVKKYNRNNKLTFTTTSPVTSFFVYHRWWRVNFFFPRYGGGLVRFLLSRLTPFTVHSLNVLESHDSIQPFRMVNWHTVCQYAASFKNAMSKFAVRISESSLNTSFEILHCMEWL